MDTKKIKELIEIMENSSLESVEIKEGAFKISMNKRTQGMAMPYIDHTLMPVQPIQALNNVEASVANEVSNCKTIDAPLVGTFYGRPAPDAQSFVTVNQKVNEGDVLCIIEAMKVMNEIKATCSGIIKSILVSDDQMVEFGQPLFEIE